MTGPDEEDLPVEDADEEVDEPDWDAWEADLQAAAEAFGEQS